MTYVDLEEHLSGGACPACKVGATYPVDILYGESLAFRCRNRNCRWFGRAALPRIRKTIVYLDTSTVSHIAKSLADSAFSSQWRDLYDALRAAATRNVLVCPSTDVMQDEFELSPLTSQFAAVAEEFGDPRIRPVLAIQEAQLFRALDRFLEGQEPSIDAVIVPEDAFYESVHRWLPRYRISLRRPKLAELIKHRREQQEVIRSGIEDTYRNLAEKDLGFEAIRQSEVGGYGQAILSDALDCFRRRLRLSDRASAPGEAASDEGSNVVDDLGALIPNTFENLLMRLKGRGGDTVKEAGARVIEFLRSEHVTMTPVADITSRLHAGMAMLARGEAPRRPKLSDNADIAHMSSFLPYVDILISDRFMVHLCNLPEMQFRERYGTEIRGLAPKEIDGFIRDIESLVSQAPQASLSDRIRTAINAAEKGRGPFC